MIKFIDNYLLHEETGVYCPFHMFPFDNTSIFCLEFADGFIGYFLLSNLFFFLFAFLISSLLSSSLFHCSRSFLTFQYVLLCFPFFLLFFSFLPHFLHTSSFHLYTRYSKASANIFLVRPSMPGLNYWQDVAIDYPLMFQATFQF